MAHTRLDSDLTVQGQRKVNQAGGAIGTQNDVWTLLPGSRDTLHLRNVRYEVSVKCEVGHDIVRRHSAERPQMAPSFKHWYVRTLPSGTENFIVSHSGEFLGLWY
jgi:hypothetical protein